MVASILKELGVFIGRSVDRAVFEDRDFAAALEAGDPAQLSRLIAERNAQHAVWGFKRPEAYRNLNDLCRLCRNPRVIVTFRDIVTIALRNQISMQMDAMQLLPRLATQYKDLVDTIERASAPCLLISYEKSVQFPLQTAQKIAWFCGLDVSDEQVREAAEVVENGTPGYLKSARLHYDGHVGRLRKGKLRGWVKVHNRDTMRVNVVLMLDGKPVQTARADLPRPDVLKAGYGDGRYGFEFAIDDRMDRNGIVDVRVENSRIVLANSGSPLSSYEAEPGAGSGGEGGAEGAGRPLAKGRDRE
jgi:hypothetical protein